MLSLSGDGEHVPNPPKACSSASSYHKHVAPAACYYPPWQGALQGNPGTPETQAGIPLHGQYITRPASCIGYMHGRELILPWLGCVSIVSTQVELSAVKENQLLLAIIVLVGLPRSSRKDSAFRAALTYTATTSST